MDRARQGMQGLAPLEDRMSKHRMLPGAAATTLAALLAGCGGSHADAGPADPAFLAAAPSASWVALQIDDSDVTAAAPAGPNGNAAADKCHPHLFSRAHDVVVRIDRHIAKMLSRVAALIADHPQAKTATSHTWSKTDSGGVGQQLAISKAQDGSFSFRLDLTPAAGPKAIKVYSGTVKIGDSSGATTIDATMTFDYDALHAAVPAEKAAGQINFFLSDLKDASKPAPGMRVSANAVLINFAPADQPSVVQSTNYQYVGEPGVGGSIEYTDAIATPCPTNPSGLAASAQLVARWYKAPDGGVHGRADAQMSGGQIPAGQTWIGTSCENNQPGQATSANVESAYWMVKVEDASGATVDGTAVESSDGASNPCDAAFGSVPTLASNSKDFSFGQGALAFPNEW
jgi:hypothetical protein